MNSNVFCVIFVSSQWAAKNIKKTEKRKEKVSHCSKGINYEIQNFLYNVAKQLLQYSAVPCRSVSSLISSQEWGTESRGRGANVSASSPKWPWAALLRGKHGELILYSHWAGCLVPSRTRKHYFLMQSPPSSPPSQISETAASNSAACCTVT